MSRGKWLTSEEERFIWEHRYTLTTSQIGERIGRRRSVVLAYLHRMGVSVKSNRKQ